MKLLYLVLMLGFLSTITFGEEDGLFTYVEKQTYTLSDRQEHLLNVIIERPFTMNVHLVMIPDASDILKRETIQLNFPGDRDLFVTKADVRESEKRDNGFLWTGKTDDPTASINFRFGIAMY